jgi:hypothetical protein
LAPLTLAASSGPAWAQRDVHEETPVSQDDFGKRALIKLNVIPVIQSLMKEPLFRARRPGF